MKSKKPCIQSKRSRCCLIAVIWCLCKDTYNLTEQCWVKSIGSFPALGARSNSAICIWPVMFILFFMSLNVDPFSGNMADGWSVA